MSLRLEAKGKQRRVGAIPVLVAQQLVDDLQAEHPSFWRTLWVAVLPRFCSRERSGSCEEDGHGQLKGRGGRRRDGQQELISSSSPNQSERTASTMGHLGRTESSSAGRGRGTDCPVLVCIGEDVPEKVVGLLPERLVGRGRNLDGVEELLFVHEWAERFRTRTERTWTEVTRKEGERSGRSCLELGELVDVYGWWSSGVGVLAKRAIENGRRARAECQRLLLQDMIRARKSRFAVRRAEAEPGRVRKRRHLIEATRQRGGM